ncbi:MAG: DMT family transporter [Casimicrobiaceae bacterium]
MSNAVRRRHHQSAYLLLTLSSLLWASNWIVGRGVSGEIPPMALTFFRWLCAIVMLAPFAWARVRRDWPQIRAHWRILLVMGSVGVGTHNALAYLGLNYTTATNGVILNSFIPVMIVTFSWAFLGERLSRTQLCGVLVSFIGVMTILSHGSLAALAGFRLNAGDLLIMVSMALWSAYSILLRRRPAGIDTLAFLFVIAVIGDCCVLPLYVGETLLGRPMHWTWQNAGVIAVLALFSSIFAYIFWNRGVAEVGASVAGLFMNLMPVFGVILAWVFLDERLAAFHVAGIGLILAGIFITSRHAAIIAPAGAEH